MVYWTSGNNAKRRLGAWLVSTLVWLPLFILTLAVDLRAIPVSSEYVPYLSGFVVMGWILAGCFSMCDYNPPDIWRFILHGISGLIGIVAVWFALTTGILAEGRPYAQILLVVVIALDVLLMIYRAAHGKITALLRQMAHSELFLIAFVVAYGLTVGLPLNQGWFKTGNPIQLSAEFIKTFGIVSLIAIASAHSLAVMVSLDRAVRAILPVVMSAAIGSGILMRATYLIPPDMAFVLVPVIIYGLAADLRQRSRAPAKTVPAAKVIRIVGAAMFILSIAGLAWLCLLSGWQAFEWHRIG
jgi:hypothetical protein